MIWYTIKQAAELAGTQVSTLHSWESRYGWPTSVRKANGYRLYSDHVIEEVREFIQAGRPIHQLDGGVWMRPGTKRIAKGAAPTFLATYADLERKFLHALHVGSEGTVAHYLAALGTMRPEVRARYVECARLANDEMGGLYSHLIARYRIAEPHRQEATA